MRVEDVMKRTWHSAIQARMPPQPRQSCGVGTAVSFRFSKTPAG